MLWYLCYVLFIDILIKMIDMISLQEAISIAQEYCDGDILDGSVDTIIPSSSKTPISWVFTIYHKDYDSNVFKTIHGQHVVHLNLWQFPCIFLAQGI